MITLKADNRVLATNAKFAYLVSNESSQVSEITVTNTEPFSEGTPILFGEFGQSEAEILKVLTVDSVTNVITLADINGDATTTVFAHAESTKITALPYDQIRFFWTAATNTIADETPPFDDGDPLTAWVALDPSSYYSTFNDTTNSTGFGWFLYKNETTDDTSTESNPIPYAGFTGNTVAQVFSDFESLLNTNELKLVTTNDKFSWLNEALAVLKNKLNLTNVEYTVQLPQTINIISGTAEYLLPDDFSDLISIVDSTSTNFGTPQEIEFLPIYKVDAYQGNSAFASTSIRYYLRNRYIGFTPTPSSNATFKYRYRAKAVRVTGFSDYIDLPDNAFYCLKDWMMYRAYLKFNNPLSNTYYQSFTNSVNLYMQAAVKRDANTDSWDIAATANV